VHGWNDRKRRFSEVNILRAWDVLAAGGWLTATRPGDEAGHETEGNEERAPRQGGLC
jgi:hypothetical protein